MHLSTIENNTIHYLTLTLTFTLTDSTAHLHSLQLRWLNFATSTTCSLWNVCMQSTCMKTKHNLSSWSLHRCKSRKRKMHDGKTWLINDQTRTIHTGIFDESVDHTSEHFLCAYFIYICKCIFYNTLGSIRKIRIGT